MKRNFWTKLGLLSLACGLFMTAPTAIINADDTTTTTTTTTSNATLNLNSSDAHLSLDAVPSFPFGTVNTGEILSHRDGHPTGCQGLAADRNVDRLYQ